MNKYFYCYSWPLKEFLIQNGCEMVMYSKNTITGKMFWVFKNGKQITELLNEWRSHKN